MNYVRVTTAEGLIWVLGRPGSNGKLEFIAEFETAERADANWLRSGLAILPEAGGTVPWGTSVGNGPHGANVSREAHVPRETSDPEGGREESDPYVLESETLILSKTQRRDAIALMRTMVGRMNERGEVTESQGSLAKDIQSSPGVVSILLRQLAKHDLISVARAGRGGLDGYPATYQIRLAKVVQAFPELAEDQT